MKEILAWFDIALLIVLIWHVVHFAFEVVEGRRRAKDVDQMNP